MQWKILPQKIGDPLSQLLAIRKIKTEKEKEEFFNPKLSDFEKVFQIPGIVRAIKRVKEAIKNGELIVVYGDYDVDGVCGAAVLYLGLTLAGAKVLPYIPHREKEGYGLSRIGLEFARDSGALVVISVDCGIVSFKEAEFAKEIGLDLIITDHHQPEKEKPAAFEIIHSLKFCGTAVAWCFIKALIGKDEAEKLLDLVAIATIADMMPLTGVNRVLAKKGIEVLRKTSRVGLAALFKQARVDQDQIDSYCIGHIIAPRLNAAGRLEHAIDALRLLCTKDSKKADILVSKIEEINDKRKFLTQEAVDNAKLKIKGVEKKIYVLSDETWAPGIIGLVAGRICEETRRPAIAISVGELESKGSARSIDGINIVETIRQCSDMLVAVGGHPGAAGFTIKTSHLEEFRERLEVLMESQDKIQKPEESVLEIESLVSQKLLKISLVKSLSLLEPFGIGNPKPILASQNMILSDIRTVGEGKHLKGNVIVDFTAEGRKVPFIAFGFGIMADLVSSGQLVDLAYTLEIDRFNSSEKLQLNVKDLKII